MSGCIVGSYALCSELNDKITSILTLKDKLNKEVLYSNITYDETTNTYTFDDSSLIADYDSIFGENFKEQYTTSGQSILPKLLYTLSMTLKAKIYKECQDKWNKLFTNTPDMYIDIMIGDRFYLGKLADSSILNYIVTDSTDVWTNVFAEFDPSIQSRSASVVQPVYGAKNKWACVAPITLLETSMTSHPDTETTATVSVYQMLLGYQMFRVIQNALEEYLLVTKKAPYGTKYVYQGDTYMIEYTAQGRILQFKKQTTNS